jgi:DNA polymerase III epsilon subunit-like protein
MEIEMGKLLSDCMNNSSIIVDIETTGLYSETHGICEIAAIEVDLDSNKVVRHFHTFSMPTNENGTEIDQINPAVTEINGITLDKLQGAPDNPNAVKKLQEFVGSRTIWAFNGAFVLPFIDKFSSKPFTIYDVMSFAKKTFPDVINRKLSSFAVFLNIPLRDEPLYLTCLTTKEVLLKCINKNESIRADNALCFSCQWSGKASDLLMFGDDYICPECSESEKLELNLPLQRIPQDIIFNDGDEFLCGVCDWKGSRLNLIVKNKKYACPRCTKSKLFYVERCSCCEWFNLEFFCISTNGNDYCPECFSVISRNPLARLDN